MSEDNQHEEQELTEDELTVLTARAAQLGIKHHPAIGLEKLRAKVAEATAPAKVPEVVAAPAAAVKESPKALTAKQLETQEFNRVKKEATKLIRVNVSCMNPSKAEWDGEIFTTGNSVTGTLKRYVHFNEVWHVEQMVLDMMEARVCQIFVTIKDRQGAKSRKGKQIKEFNIERLTSLSAKDLKELEQRQAMAGGTSEV